MVRKSVLRDRIWRGFYSRLIGSYGARDEKRRPIPDSGLLGFVGRELELAAPQPDGCTLREHLKNFQRQSGEHEPLLDPVECDDAVKYLWQYLLSMNARRTYNGFGPNPITDEGVEAWARRRGIRLERWEHKALDALEQLYLAKAAEKK